MIERGKKREVSSDPVNLLILNLNEFMCFYDGPKFEFNQQVKYSDIVNIWDDFLLSPSLINQAKKDKKLHQKISVLNEQVTLLLGDTITKLINDHYLIFRRNAINDLENDKDMYEVTRPLANLAKYLNEYIRNQLLAREEILSFELLFQRYVQLAVLLTHQGNFFGAEAIYQAFSFADIQKIYDKNGWEDLPPIIRIQLFYLDSLYNTGEIQKEKLFNVAQNTVSSKFLHIGKVTAKFGVEFGSREENLILSKINISQQLKNSEEKNLDLNTFNMSIGLGLDENNTKNTKDLVKSTEVNEYKEKLNKIDQAINELCINKIKYLKHFFDNYLKLYVNYELNFSETAAKEIFSIEASRFLIYSFLSLELKTIRKYCEDKLGRIRLNHDNPQEHAKLLYEQAVNKIELIVFSNRKHSFSIEVLENFYEEQNVILKNIHKHDNKLTLCVNAIDRLTSVITLLVNWVKEYELECVNKAKQLVLQKDKKQSTKKNNLFYPYDSCLDSHELLLKILKFRDKLICKINKGNGILSFKERNDKNKEKVSKLKRSLSIIDGFVALFANLSHYSAQHVGLLLQCMQLMSRLLTSNGDLTCFYRGDTLLDFALQMLKNTAKCLSEQYGNLESEIYNCVKRFNDIYKYTIKKIKKHPNDTILINILMEYARLQFSSIEEQVKFFEKSMDSKPVSESVVSSNLPIFFLSSEQPLEKWRKSSGYDLLVKFYQTIVQLDLALSKLNNKEQSKTDFKNK